MDESQLIPLRELRDEMDKISPTFCAAKWQQVTLHLQIGQTHSCHHPRPHKIPTDELDINPSALHNTNYKKLQRKKMLEGERPEECGYCWKVEDSSAKSISDRVYKSNENWAKPFINAIAEKAWDEDVAPSYLEVSFSSVCNFACSYCSPQFSSKWMDEIKSKGAYPTSTKFNNLEWLKRTDAMPIPHREENPYVDAFWKWWPDIYSTLSYFRITGGEPLLAKDTFKVLDYIIANPNPNLEVAVNSNMCPPPELLNKFIEKIKIIVNEKKVKRFKIFTSCEAYGKRAEYIRHGLDYNEWKSNIEKVLTEVPGITFTVMSTYNALSVHSYVDFLKDILDFRVKFQTENERAPVILDIPYLRFPNHQSVFILPKDMLTPIQDQINFMCDNTISYEAAGFHLFEIDKFKRIYEMLINRPDEKFVTLDQRDFVSFVNEHDKRRGTNFLETFPEFKDVYEVWGD